MKRWAFRIIAAMALILLMSYALGSIDYWRISIGNRPWFVLNWEGYFDGGTFVGCGLGYTVYANHGVMYSMRHGKEFQDYDFTTGPEIEYWCLPFLNKSRLESEPFQKRLQQIKND